MTGADVSSGEEDSRFRIPRGSSDEEIDSDLAFGPGPDSPESDSDDNQDNIIPAKSASPKPSREEITKKVYALLGGTSSSALSLSDAGDDDDDDDDEGYNGDEEEDEISTEALAKVTAAVTKRDLTVSASRHVDVCTTAEPSSTTPVASSSAAAPSHPDMINRMLHTLRASDIAGSASLPKLEKKMNRLYSETKQQLAVPLPAPVSERLERAAAYKQTAKEITEKWTDTVIRNRRADHLVFPLNEPRHPLPSTKDLANRKTKKKKTIKSKTDNGDNNDSDDIVDHESEIADILKEAGVTKDADALQTEMDAVDHALSSGKVSMEDVIQRQRELARVRSLVFHYDQKMKRIKKIKSKKYRREMKKDRERVANGTDPLDSDAEMEEAIVAERRRIEERVTQRHKNTSKWVRRQLQRGEAKRDEATRAAIEDQLRLHEELKRRQNREVEHGTDDSDDDINGGHHVGSDLDSEDISEDEELANIEKQLANGSSDSKPKPKKGIMSLRFMQAAEERKRKEALALLKEMKDDYDDNDDNDDDATNDQIVGRKSFAGSEEQHDVPKKRTAKQRRNEDDEDNNETVEGDRHLMENDDDDEDIKVLEQRVKDDYEKAEEANSTSRVGAKGEFNPENAAETIRDAAKSTNDFTTRLEGRLAADDDNPWLVGMAISSDKNNVHSAKNAQNPNTAMENESAKQKRKRVNVDDAARSKQNVQQNKTPQIRSELTVEPQSSSHGSFASVHNGRSHSADVKHEQPKPNENLAQKNKRKRKRGKRGASENPNETSQAAAPVTKRPDEEVSVPTVTTPKNSSNSMNTKSTKEEGTENDTERRKAKRRRKKTRDSSTTVTEKPSSVDKPEGNSSELVKDSETGAELQSDFVAKVGSGDEINPMPVSSAFDLEDVSDKAEAENNHEAADLARMEEIAEAFAGVGGADLSEFEATKEAEVEKNLPTAKSLNAEVLPGWGSWDGAGMSKKAKENRKESAFVRAARERYEEARANAVQSRSDRNMRNVILEQKRYESATKMTLASVPYPFQSREEWERELSRPLCRELASNTAIRQGVRRKVDVKLGTIIEPIQTPAPSRDVSKPSELVSRGGKQGVIDLRKAKSKHRSSTRRGLLS